MGWVFAGRSSWIGRWLPLLLGMGVVFFASHQPTTELPYFGSWDLWFKKTGHFLGYALLAVLALRAVLNWKRPYIAAIIILLAFSLSDEFHQTFIPSRHGALVDVFIDMCGVGSSLLFLHWRQLTLQQTQDSQVFTGG